MRILHTADLHLGKRLERFDRLPEQREVMAEICAVADAYAVDAVVIAGDLFDTFNPPNEAVELFYQSLRRLTNQGTRPVIAIAGNHDSPDRIEAPDPLARACGIIFAGRFDTEVPLFSLETGVGVVAADRGFISVEVPGHTYPLRVLMTPFINEHRMAIRAEGTSPHETVLKELQSHWKGLAEKYCDTEGVNLLVTHLFMVQRGGEIPEEPEDERPVLVGGAGMFFTDSIPPQIQYAALGHLHRKQEIKGAQGPCIYPSSPLAYSFGEAGQQKFVSIVDLEPGKPAEIQFVPLQSGFPLLKKTFGNVDEAVQWLAENQDCFVELSIQTESFISGSDRKRLLEAHPRVIGPIPIFTGSKTPSESPQLRDLTKSREALFKEFFFERKGVEPSASLLSLFQEIISLDPSHAEQP